MLLLAKNEKILKMANRYKIPNLNENEFDPNKYVVRIVPVKTYEKSVLKGVARLCMCNTLEAKRILEENGFEFKPMDALDTKSLKKKIEDVGCEYTISPEFRW